LFLARLLAVLLETAAEALLPHVLVLSGWMRLLSHNRGIDQRFPNKDQDEGRPSKLNHGNVTPSFIDDKTKQLLHGGVTIDKAVQTTVLSLSALRRLRFPLNGSADSNPDADISARTALAALGIAAATLARGDADLRSRCQLFPQQQPLWELLAVPGEAPKQFTLSPEGAIALANAAIEQAKKANLPWEGELVLKPSDELVELVRRSQVLASASGEGDE
ncbi:MAG: hypothetical protein ACOY4D_11330, partial [Pseudomonadota bacterium]